MCVSLSLTHTHFSSGYWSPPPNPSWTKMPILIHPNKLHSLVEFYASILLLHLHCHSLHCMIGTYNQICFYAPEAISFIISKTKPKLGLTPHGCLMRSPFIIKCPHVELYTTRLVVWKTHENEMCHDEIGLWIQYIDVILGNDC